MVPEACDGLHNWRNCLSTSATAPPKLYHMLYSWNNFLKDGKIRRFLLKNHFLPKKKGVPSALVPFVCFFFLKTWCAVSSTGDHFLTSFLLSYSRTLNKYIDLQDTHRIHHKWCEGRYVTCPVTGKFLKLTEVLHIKLALLNKERLKDIKWVLHEFVIFFFSTFHVIPLKKTVNSLLQQ